MSDEDLDQNDSEGIKNLRKQYEEMQKELKALREENGNFKASQRQATVAEVLKAKGLPEKVAKLYQGEDASPEAVGKWAEEYADVFGVPAASEESNANAESAGRVANASYGATGSIQNTPGGKVFGDPEAIRNAIQTLPYDELVKQGYMPAEGQLFNQPRR